jgi:polyphosphate kinase 2 (PPK2 family)
MLERADKTQAYRILRTQESKIIDRYRVTDGAKFRLKNYDPADTAGHQSDKPLARALLEGGVLRLSEQQEKLYAQDRWAMLRCFQAMDAAGKDSTIKHVMSGVNPQGVQVTSFKVPGPEDLDHDFFGASFAPCPRAGASASSTEAITRKCWPCVCIQRCSRSSTFRFR